MQDKELYEKLPGLTAPWSVQDVDLQMKEMKVTLKLTHQPFWRFRCPECDEECPTHDHRQRLWRHLDTCGYKPVFPGSIARNTEFVPLPQGRVVLNARRDLGGLTHTKPISPNARKKLKVFRLEAVRAGFKIAWQERDYAVIVAVADKIPNNVLEEDPKLLMWYDQAVTRMGS